MFCVLVRLESLSYSNNNLSFVVKIPASRVITRDTTRHVETVLRTTVIMKTITTGKLGNYAKWTLI